MVIANGPHPACPDGESDGGLNRGDSPSESLFFRGSPPPAANRRKQGVGA